MTATRLSLPVTVPGVRFTVTAAIRVTNQRDSVLVHVGPCEALIPETSRVAAGEALPVPELPLDCFLDDDFEGDQGVFAALAGVHGCLQRDRYKFLLLLFLDRRIFASSFLQRPFFGFGIWLYYMLYQHVLYSM